MPEKILEITSRKDAEIERYKGVIKLLEKDVRDAKSEAYKELAHLLIDKAENDVIHISDISDFAVELIKENEGNESMVCKFKI